MLNPSTADERKDDPTVRKCIQYARDWGFGGLIVVNLFAVRSTDPRNIYVVNEPIGPKNDEAILEAARDGGVVVGAWGNHGGFGGRSMHVRGLLAAAGVELHALRVTQEGEPYHPLYQRAELRPRPFEELAREL